MKTLRNERGSILYSLLFAVLMMGLVATILNWLSNSNQLIRYSRQKIQVENAARQILSSVETCITNLRQGGGGNNCPRKNEFVALTNLGNATPAPITLSWSDLTTTSNFLTNQMPLISSAISTASATVTRIASAEDPLLGATTIVLRVEASPSTGFFSFNTAAVTKTFRISLQNPASFALILRDTNTTPKLDLQNQTKLTIYGKTLFWENGDFNPSELVSTSDFPRLSLDRLYTTGSHINLMSAADQQIFTGLRALGVQTSWLAGANDPFAGGFAADWNQPLDYQYVYLTNGYPLPQTNPISSHGASDPRDFVAASAAATTFPNATVMGTNNLEKTCTRPANFNVGSIQTLILNRNTSNLTLDFTLGGGATYACGQVLADNITIVTPNATTVVWYGNIIAKRLIVTGGGELVILNPFAYSQAPSGLPAPANLNSSDLMQMFMALDSSTGHNFFVPFSRNPGVLPAALKSRKVSDLFVACGAKMCWPLSVDPPDLSAMYSAPGCDGSSTPGGSCWSENVYYSTDEAN